MQERLSRWSSVAMPRGQSGWLWSCAVLLILLSTAPGRGELAIHGFLEVAGGGRIGDDPHQTKDATLGEMRLELERSQPGPAGLRLFLKGDFLLDAVAEEADLDLREAYLDLPPLKQLEVRLGRQILTWGTGDLVFINDAFPKDFVSFFIGRADPFLKVPSDALKLSLFTDLLSADLVVVPRFEPDDFPKGERLSFFNPFTGALAGPEAALSVHRPPSGTLEAAGRLYRTLGSYEVAFYGFRGFFKQPLGIRDPARRELFFPKLAVYGASVRGPVFAGIGNLEVGYYDSLEDCHGRDPLIENSSLKYLLGYEQEVATDFTVRFQYFVEQMLQYDRFKAALPLGAPPRDEVRHLLTLRLTQLLWYQTLTLSLIAFYSPSDQDAYLRPTVAYHLTDQFTVTAGANVFVGAQHFTPFGQLDANDNLFVRLTYRF